MKEKAASSSATTPDFAEPAASDTSDVAAPRQRRMNCIITWIVPGIAPDEDPE